MVDDLGLRNFDHINKLHELGLISSTSTRMANVTQKGWAYIEKLRQIPV
jgi:hypothetical protein